MNENQDQNPDRNEAENPSEIIKPSENKRVEVSADLLNEAVVQLRKMAEIRQRDSERQERAIAQMQKSLKRQGILSRYVVLMCLIVVIISAGLAYFMWQSAKTEKTTISTLTNVNDSLTSTAQTIAQETQKQVSTLDNVRGELQASRQVQESVLKKVEEQLGTVRQERDAVTGEVRSMLEEKTEMFTRKEIELRAEREAIKEAKQRSKEEQKELIQQTIERLNAMTASLASDEETIPDEAATDEQIDAVVSEVDAVEATMTEEPAAPTEVEDVPAEDSPAAEEPAANAEEPAANTEVPPGDTAL